MLLSSLDILLLVIVIQKNCITTTAADQEILYLSSYISQNVFASWAAKKCCNNNAFLSKCVLLCNCVLLLQINKNSCGLQRFEKILKCSYQKTVIGRNLPLKA